MERAKGRWPRQVPRPGSPSAPEHPLGPQGQQRNLVPGLLPGGILQGPGEGGVVVGGVLQGVIPRGGGLHAGVRALTAQRVLQRPVKGCFAAGPALAFLKLL